MNKRIQGKVSENIAIGFLIKKGFELLDENYYVQGGEIDIVTKHENYIVFVEVKSIKSERFVKLEETITEKKRKSLIRASKLWLIRNKYKDVDWRIDFVGIVVDNGYVEKIMHLENAIY